MPPTRPRLARACWVLVLLYWAAMFGLTHLPTPRLPYVPVTDKTAHFVAYFLLGAGLYTAVYLRGQRGAGDVAVVVLTTLIAYGAVDEWTQLLVNRSCERADWFADVAGAATAVAIAATLAPRLTRAADHT
ncbi:MAG TPA: VanZ family protein [Tepidisphaeraceae bacterium]|nr:VanZ family protein [Tepidisphaeraceae bacterium]